MNKLQKKNAISGPKVRRFLLTNSPPNGQISKRLPKGTSLHGSTRFGALGAAVWRAVRPVHVEKKVGKNKIKKAPNSVYFKPSPGRPPKGCKFETSPV